MKKIKYKIVLCILFLISYSIHSQFQIAIGGTSADGANSIIQTKDGGYVVAGSTHSMGAGSYDTYIAKIGSNNTLQWTRSVGGTGNDVASSIIQSSDDGFIFAGSSSPLIPGNPSLLIVKLDYNGTYQWMKYMSGGSTASCIIQTADGGYALTGGLSLIGAGSEDVLIVKIDSNGLPQWVKTIGGSGFDIALSIIQTFDGGYAVGGHTSSFGAGMDDMYIIKLNSNGNFQWSRTVGGSDNDIAFSIMQTTDGGYVLGGSTSSFGTGNDNVYVVKLDTAGLLQWTKTVGGGSSKNAYSFTQTVDGGYVGAGYSFGSNYEAYILKLDANGTSQWAKTFGGTSSEEAFSIIQTTDHAYVVAGETESFGSGDWDMYIVKLDSNGNTCGSINPVSTISGSGGILGFPNSIVNSPTLNVSSQNLVSSSGGILTNICAIGIHPISMDIPKSFSLSQNYPNPFNPATKIKFSIPLSRGVPEGRGVFTKLIIYDLLGREDATLVNEQLKPGTYEVQWDASTYSSGVYFYKLMTESFSDTKKMVLIK